MTQAPPPEVLAGIALFNQTRWFEAHELLEQAWLAEPTNLRRLYQGILQIGVALHHARNGNQRGALTLLDRGMSHLAPFEPAALGIDITRLVRDATAARRALAAPGGLTAYDFTRAPKVHLAPEP